MTPLQARFWAKVQKGSPEQCWPWTGYMTPSGHGGTSYKTFCMYAHRKAWILTHGPIPSGLCVNHRCDNGLCCNPAHMYLGSRIDNMIDRFAKPPGESRGPCGRPHVLTEAQLEQLWKKRQAGATLKECASYFNVHMATICRYITSIRRARALRLHADRLSAIAKHHP